MQNLQTTKKTSNNFKLNTMKSTYAIAAALLFSISAFAQKDELKAMKKLEDKMNNLKEGEMPKMEDIAEYKRLLGEAEAKLGAATDEQKIEIYYHKGSFAVAEALMNNSVASTNTAVESFNKVIELEKGSKKQKYTKEIQDLIFPEIKATLVKYAGEYAKQQKFKEVVSLYDAAYKVSPSDTIYLYNAAANAVNAKEYDTALKYYEQLDKLGFTNQRMYYTAKNSNGEVEYYTDKKTRDLLVTAKSHTEPGVFKEPSRRGDIVKNIALLYIQKKDHANAMKAIENAKKTSPNDTSLMMAEAQIYFEAGDMEGYKRTIQGILNNGSKDPVLYFNLGVVAMQGGQNAEAEQYYLKAIEIKPDYADPYVNIATLQLAGEDKIVEEMNSPKTNDKRYNELKKQRDDKYRKAMKYLEQGYKAVQSPENANIKSNLGIMYQALDMEAEYKALKAAQ